ncbi:MAG TPA: glycosyltransferase family 4 protein [Stellaceae bacterium]|nr:glycosyltransferase family 4 protein [Stellaceae bacterium]
MRIAQIAPLYESCPPQLYGGTERVVSYLTEELVRQGHQVTLFASGDSRTAAELCAPCPRALRLDPGCQDPLVHHMVMLDQVARRAEAFDILHFHIDYLHFPLFADRGGATLTTTHGRLDIPDLSVLFREFPRMPLASISNSQRKPVAWANWCGTVYHGLPLDLYSLGSGDGGYLAFIGRISPEKRPDWAIEIARRAGVPLSIAAKVDKPDRAYYKSKIKPLLKDPLIDFLGEIGEDEKGAFLGDAMALLFPIDWPEPFGLAMIEAMANGTPVIAMRRGSVPEIIDHGVTGFIVDTVEEAAAAVPRAKDLDRTMVRRRFEERFSAGRMARDYVALYRERLGHGAARPDINGAAVGAVSGEAAWTAA